MLSDVMPNSLRKLLFNELENGLPGISKAWGKFLGEAGSLCLSLKNHASGVEMQIKGDAETVFRFFWSNEITEQTRLAWNDIQELTEYGAAGIAILLIQELTEFMVIRRAVKGDGIDYWLGNKNDKEPFQDAARLEVSGIFSGNESRIKARLEQKKRQTFPSDGDFPAFVIVVEFSKPVSYLERK
jgi:hypothetical protein